MNHVNSKNAALVAHHHCLQQHRATYRPFKHLSHDCYRVIMLFLTSVDTANAVAAHRNFYHAAMRNRLWEWQSYRSHPTRYPFYENLLRLFPLSNYERQIAFQRLCRFQNNHLEPTRYGFLSGPGHVLSICQLWDGGFATGCHDGFVRQYSRLGLLKSSFKAHLFAVNCMLILAFDRLITGSQDGSVSIWQNCASRIGHYRAHQGAINCMRQLQGGQIVIGSYDNTISIVTFNPMSINIVNGVTSNDCLLPLLDGNFVTSAMNHEAQLLSPEGTLLQTFKGHTCKVCSLAALPTHYLATGSADHDVRIWNLLDGKLITILKGHSNQVLSLASLPNGDLVSAGLDRTIIHWKRFANEFAVKTINLIHQQISSVKAWPNGDITFALLDGRIGQYSAIGSAFKWSYQGSTVQKIVVFAAGGIAAISFGKVYVECPDKEYLIKKPPTSATLKKLRRVRRTFNAFDHFSA